MKDGEKSGPYSIDHLKAMWQQKMINEETLYLKDGFASPMPLSAIASIYFVDPPAASVQNKRNIGVVPFGVRAMKIHAGDFPNGVSDSDLYNLESLEVATQENVKSIAAKIGWGIAGAAILGPVGLLAGVLGGGNKTEITFLAHFSDGKNLIATTDPKTFTYLKSLTLS
jgi:hypothetical protein